MASVNRIGEFLFLTLKGEIQTKREHVRTLTRAGVEGIAFALDGIWGEPFDLESQLDHLSVVKADEAHQEYLELLGKDPVDLVYTSTTFGTVKVVDIQQGGLETVGCMVGGFNIPLGGAGYIARTIWTLVHIDDRD